MDDRQGFLDFSPSENERAVFERVIRAFWARAPTAAGVLLLSERGRPLAYDLVHTDDPGALATTAVAQRAEARRHSVPYGPGSPAGTLVDVDGGKVLAVFLPDDFADEFPQVEIPDGIAA